MIENLGDCIKNNAAASIFNKDLDARNYGVSHFLKVYLYDYDALEDFRRASRFAATLDRIDGEEDIPGLVFRGRRDLPARGNRGGAVHSRTARHRQLFQATCTATC